MTMEKRVGTSRSSLTGLAGLPATATLHPGPAKHSRQVEQVEQDGEDEEEEEEEEEEFLHFPMDYTTDSDQSPVPRGRHVVVCAANNHHNSDLLPPFRARSRTTDCFLAATASASAASAAAATERSRQLSSGQLSTSQLSDQLYLRPDSFDIPKSRRSEEYAYCDLSSSAPSSHPHSIPESSSRLGSSHSPSRASRFSVHSVGSALPGTSYESVGSLDSCSNQLSSKSPGVDSKQKLHKIFRSSISKIFPRSRSKISDGSLGQDQGLSRTPESEQSMKDCAMTRKIVSESLKKGLPVIPFGYPTITLMEKKFEDTKTFIRKNSECEFAQSVGNHLGQSVGNLASGRSGNEPAHASDYFPMERSSRRADKEAGPPYPVSSSIRYSASPAANIPSSPDTGIMFSLSDPDTVPTTHTTTIHPSSGGVPPTAAESNYYVMTDKSPGNRLVHVPLSSSSRTPSRPPSSFSSTVATSPPPPPPPDKDSSYCYMKSRGSLTSSSSLHCPASFTTTTASSSTATDDNSADSSSSNYCVMSPSPTAANSATSPSSAAAFRSHRKSGDGGRTPFRISLTNPSTTPPSNDSYCFMSGSVSTPSSLSKAAASSSSSSSSSSSRAISAGVPSSQPGGSRKISSVSVRRMNSIKETERSSYSPSSSADDGYMVADVGLSRQLSSTSSTSSLRPSDRLIAGSPSSSLHFPASSIAASPVSSVAARGESEEEEGNEEDYCDMSLSLRSQPAAVAGPVGSPVACPPPANNPPPTSSASFLKVDRLPSMVTSSSLQDFQDENRAPFGLTEEELVMQRQHRSNSVFDESVATKLNYLNKITQENMLNKKFKKANRNRGDYTLLDFEASRSRPAKPSQQLLEEKANKPKKFFSFTK